MQKTRRRRAGSLCLNLAYTQLGDCAVKLGVVISTIRQDFDRLQPMLEAYRFGSRERRLEIAV